MSSNHFRFRQLVTLSLLASFGAIACGDGDEANGAGGDSTEKRVETGGAGDTGGEMKGDDGGTGGAKSASGGSGGADGKGSGDSSSA